MLNLVLPLFALSGLVFAGNWYVAAYGDITVPEPATRSITNFAECVAAGYPVMESYPEQCRTDDGQTFVNPAAPQPLPTEPDTVSEPLPATNEDETQLAATAAVRVQAAKDLGVDEGVIDIIRVTKAQWPDGCLGIGEADQMCIMMLTHGYEVTVTGNNETVVYRTDQTGAVVKMEPR